MKALILAGGRGTRLRPLTHTKNKHLLPIGNEPMIFRVITDAIEAGMHEIIININSGDLSIQEAINKRKWNANFHYIEQAEPNGMMFPILMARDLIGDEDFMLIAGDNVLSGGLKKYVKEFKSNNSDAHLLVTKEKDREKLKSLGVAIVENGKMIEKPKEFISDLVVTGFYMYNSSIFEAMKHVEPIDPKGDGKAEYYPPPAHQWLIDHGYKVTVTEVTGWWKDTGKPNDLLLANRLVLERKTLTTRKGELLNTDIEGDVEILDGAKITNSKLRGPISIGSNVVIENSYIGPFTSIGENTIIVDSQIENSILMGNVKINSVKRRLDSCLIGWNAEISEKKELPSATSLFIGDDSKVVI